jgi:formylglycine-generating enzyme required for sulfatase activity
MNWRGMRILFFSAIAAVAHAQKLTRENGQAVIDIVSAVDLTQDEKSTLKEAQDLQRQVELAVQHGDMPAVLKAMDRFHQLHWAFAVQDAVGLQVAKPPLPVALRLVEAKAASSVKDATRAADALEAFLKTASADTPGYQEALGLRRRYQQASAAAKTVRRKAAQEARPTLVRAIEQQMVDIPAGSFQMGDLSGINQYDHKPRFKTVSVKSFSLSRFEVTNEQYDQYLTATGSEHHRSYVDGYGKRPVTFVNWVDAQGFVKWLNERTERKFRLPTEAEWEYAARAGSRTEYPWGNTFDSRLANGNGTGPGDPWGMMAPVGSFPPNAWGLHDMIGNVMEWTQDCFEDPDGNATVDGSTRGGPRDCRHVSRGGSWLWPPYYLYSSSRFEANIPGDPEIGDGIRLAQDR